MKMELPEVGPEERTPLVESLLAIIRQLLDRVQQLEGTVQESRDEIAVLKGQQPRPKISRSRLESPAPLPKGGNRPSSYQCSKNRQRIIPEDVRLLADNLPAGAVLKGFHGEPAGATLLCLQGLPGLQVTASFKSRKEP
jgi:hypothetical protein